MTRPDSPATRARRADAKDAEVGRRIRALRLEKGISQTALAGQIGVSFQQVQKYENGMNRIGAGRLERIAAALGVQVGFFFDESKRRKRADAKPESVFGYMQSKRAVRLVKAFDRIRDRKARSALIALAEGLAEQA